VVILGASVELMSDQNNVINEIEEKNEDEDKR